ncbi:MAG: trigger factor [Bacteroidaceae bacterium]|nr:trigger factor [Bacteroidaceae bacterium]
MNVSHSNIDQLNAVVSIEIEKADYADKVKKSLRAYGDRANIPGFRRGHVPFSVLVKMFGKSVKAEEINRLISESLYNYISDNKLNILGEPMTAEDQTVDIENEENFTFKFDIALAPEINVTIDNNIEVPYYTIAVTDDMVAKQDEMFRQRQGKQITVDTMTEEKDLIKGSMVELENGVAKEGGIVVESTILSPAYLKAQKENFNGVKVGDKVVFNPAVANADSVGEVASILNIDREVAAEVKSDFEMTVTEITHLQPAEHDQEFFDAIFGKDAVKNDEEYTTKVREMIAMQLAPESDYRFGIDARKAIEAVVGELELPAEFLKRWLVATNEKYTDENINEEYSKMEADLKWHLIKEHIAKSFEVKVSDEDLKAIAIGVTRQQFAQYGMSNVPEELLENYSQEMLKSKESRAQLIDRATEMKIQDAIKNAVKLVAKEVSTEEFGKLFQE